MVAEEETQTGRQSVSLIAEINPVIRKLFGIFAVTTTNQQCCPAELARFEKVNRTRGAIYKLHNSHDTCTCVTYDHRNLTAEITISSPPRPAPSRYFNYKAISRSTCARTANYPPIAFRQPWFNGKIKEAGETN